MRASNPSDCRPGAHHVEVVVLTGHAEALLAVACALPALRIVAQEDSLELVHARVREHERRVVMRNHRRRTHKEVALGFKELDERFAHLRRSHSRHNVSLLFYERKFSKVVESTTSKFPFLASGYLFRLISLGLILTNLYKRWRSPCFSRIKNLYQ